MIAAGETERCLEKMKVSAAGGASDEKGGKS
jgi:hypothetical protein